MDTPRDGQKCPSYRGVRFMDVSQIVLSNCIRDAQNDTSCISGGTGLLYRVVKMRLQDKSLISISDFGKIS